jgi:hypothetical protein
LFDGRLVPPCRRALPRPERLLPAHSIEDAPSSLRPASSPRWRAFGSEPSSARWRFSLRLTAFCSRAWRLPRVSAETAHGRASIGVRIAHEPKACPRLAAYPNLERHCVLNCSAIPRPTPRVVAGQRQRRGLRGRGMTDTTFSIATLASRETPSKRLANLFKEIVRQKDEQDRRAAPLGKGAEAPIGRSSARVPPTLILLGATERRRPLGTR